MKYQLREIEIYNYRSISHAKLSSSNGKFVLIGKNSVGKTNVLQFIADVLRIDGRSHDNPAFNSKYSQEISFLNKNKPLILKLKYKILDAIGIPSTLLNHQIIENGESYFVITFTKELEKNNGEYYIGRTDISNPEFVKIERQKYFNALFIQSLRTLGSRHTDDFSTHLGNISFEQVLGYYIRVYVRRKKNEVNNMRELIIKLQDSISGDFIKSVAPDVSITISGTEIDKINKNIKELKKDDTDEFSRGKQIANLLTISVQDHKQGIKTKIRDIGEGLQNLIIIQLYLELERLYPGNCILLIDEVESNLHPPLLKKVIKYLLLSEIQLIVSTHSPIIVPEVKIEQVHYMRKEINDGKVQSTIDKIIPLPEHENRIIKELTTSSSELFFADKVILVEGISDKIFLQKVADIINPKNNLTFIETHSKSNFHVFTNILLQLKIPFAIVCDRDVLDEPSNFSKVLTQISLSKKDLNDEKILEANNIFILSKGEIEDYYPTSIICQMCNFETIQDLQEQVEKNRLEEKEDKSLKIYETFLANSLPKIISNYQELKLKFEPTVALEKATKYTIKLWQQQPKISQTQKRRKTGKIYQILTSKKKPEIAIEVCKQLQKSHLNQDLIDLIDKFN